MPHINGKAVTELAQQAGRGHSASFEALLRIHVPDLERYIHRQLPSDLRGIVDAQDVVQDTLLEACRRFGEFQLVDPTSVYRWLATIARHRMIDLLRQHRSLKRGGGRSATESALVEDELVPMLQDLAVYERTPSQSAMSHERRLALQCALETLRAIYRDVLRLRYFEALPVADVAIRLGRGEPSVHMLCNRALKELRRRLTGV